MAAKVNLENAPHEMNARTTSISYSSTLFMVHIINMLYYIYIYKTKLRYCSLDSFFNIKSCDYLNLAYKYRYIYIYIYSFIYLLESEMFVSVDVYAFFFNRKMYMHLAKLIGYNLAKKFGK